MQEDTAAGDFYTQQLLLLRKKGNPNAEFIAAYAAEVQQLLESIILHGVSDA